MIDLPYETRVWRSETAQLKQNNSDSVEHFVHAPSVRLYTDKILEPKEYKLSIYSLNTL